MRHVLSAAVIVMTLAAQHTALADEVTLLAAGGMRCSMTRIAPEFEQKTGHAVKVTIGGGAATHRQILQGEPLDVPIVQPPYQDIVASGHVVAGSETLLATIAPVLIVRKGVPKPDISTPDAVRRALLATNSLSYPDGAGPPGGALGVSGALLVYLSSADAAVAYRACAMSPASR
jgi:molybdate transport system substrate-binding protein